MEKERLPMRQKRVKKKMVYSVLLQVLGFVVMVLGAIGIVAHASGLWLLLAGTLIGMGIMLFIVGTDIQPYKDWGWEKDKEGDLLNKELKALGGKE